MLTMGRLQPQVEELVHKHIQPIETMWFRNRHLYDLLGMLRVERTGQWSLAMSGRQDKLAEVPELLREFPLVAQPAWQAGPLAVPGAAMWLIVGAPSGNWTCLRVKRALTAMSGVA
jgi:hypothetical protein